MAAMPSRPLGTMSEGAEEIQGRVTTTPTVVEEQTLDEPLDSVLLHTDSTDLESVLDLEEPRQDQGESPPGSDRGDILG